MELFWSLFLEWKSKFYILDNPQLEFSFSFKSWNAVRKGVWIIHIFFSTPLWHFFDNPLCKNQKIRFIRSTRENIKKRHRNIEKKIRSLASGNVLTQGFFSPERKGKKNSAVSRKRRKRKFLQVSLLKKCKVGVRRDRTYKLCILSGKLDRLKSHILPSRGMLFI